jgi:hypothetical protein
MKKKKDGFERLLDFLDFLREQKIQFRIEQQQPEAVMVTFALVGFRIEVEFFADELQFSVFTGHEDVSTDEKQLYDLIKKNWD